MKKFLIAGGVIIVAAVMVGLFLTMGPGFFLSLPRMLLSALQDGSQAERPTVTWTTPTPSPTRTPEPSPTSLPTFPPTYTPTPVRPTATPTPTVYVIWYSVQPGDTLASIAAQFGVKPEDILNANKLPAGVTVYPGQILVIPAPKSTPTPLPTWTPTPTSTATATP